MATSQSKRSNRNKEDTECQSSGRAAGLKDSGIEDENDEQKAFENQPRIKDFAK
jgi:hypothetical protein